MTLIFDIETSCLTGKPDPAKDEFKFMGAYEYETDKYHFVSEPKEVLELFKRHRVIIGFNSKHYDEPILKRAGLFKHRHCHIDLREVIKKRQTLLNCKYESKSLSNMAKFFGLRSSKGSFDYNILKKDKLTAEELESVKKYTIQDIKVTKEMFDHLHDYFKPFKEYLNNWDIKNYKWLTSSIGVYCYKVICNLIGIREEYSDEYSLGKYKGGYVSEPTTAEIHDDVYILDYNSLYPHIFIQGNLYSYRCNCCTDEEKWKGDGFFKLTGSYCSKKRGKIEKLLKEFYNKRLRYKALGDKREQALKLILNTIYGLAGSTIFKNLYNKSTASDCTSIARKCTKFARNKYREAGYEVLYSDTDSVFIKDIYKDKERLMMIKDVIIEELKSYLPFSTQTFDMGIDAEIKHIWFFKKHDKFLKKHYLYVNIDNKVIVKGLPMIKNDSSKIGYTVFKRYMLEHIKLGNVCFKYNDIKGWLETILSSNLELACRKFKVSDLKSYKNNNSIQAQISLKYGKGTHLLLPNTKYGVGKSVRYCTIEELKEQGLNLNALVLNKFWSEMEIFSDYIPNKSKAKKDKKLKHNQKALLQWTNIE